MSTHAIAVSQETFTSVEKGQRVEIEIPATQTSIRQFAQGDTDKIQLFVVDYPEQSMVFPFNGQRKIEKEGKSFFAIPLKNRQYGLFGGM